MVTPPAALRAARPPKTANFLPRHPRHNYCLAATLYLRAPSDVQFER